MSQIVREFIKSKSMQRNPKLPKTPEVYEAIKQLIHYCGALSCVGVLGPYQYQNKTVSNGNLSVRVPGGFVITASQLSSKYDLTPEDFAFVEGYDVDKNEMYFFGRKDKSPSSESPLHLYLYSETDAKAIVHGHESRNLIYPPGDIWKKRGIVETESTKGIQGTREIAYKVIEVLENPHYYVVMKDHSIPSGDDVGFVTLGQTLEEAAERARDVHSKLLKYRGFTRKVRF